MTPKTVYNADTHWTHWAIHQIEADYRRSADTHLLTVPLPALREAGIDLYLKDESTHPTGSLKHRLARSLFLYALCNNWLQAGQPVIEASSGSTAVSEAYFARLLGLPFFAVMTRNTSQEKIDAVHFYGGQCHFVDKADEVYSAAHALAKETNGHYMDQFTYAERATDWRGNNNIAQSIFEQMACERFPVPAWIVVGAGTGGTSATIGRFIRYKHYESRLCLADPEGSAFSPYWKTRDTSVNRPGSRIEGIGRPAPVASFLPTLIDRVHDVPNIDSMAGMIFLDTLLERKVGPSTGCNFTTMLLLAHEMQSAGQQGSIVSLICDSGDRYLHNYQNSQWRTEQFGECALALDTLHQYAMVKPQNSA
ncbi:MAG: PLP-dependent cysteine synthase family protein [Fluviibacter sp.]|jgi:cysteine synthase A